MYEHPTAPARLKALILALERGLVERGQAVRLALLAALSGEHILLVGPPGTAKSELARRLHTAFREGRYFERLLTRFTVPEEMFGPLSIRALEEDRYERHTDGFLPDASIAFIDEVFKANSAILNALLTLLNEREFDNGAGRQRCPLVSVVGATNEVPENEVSEAFFDRFLLRLPVAPVSEAGFLGLLRGEVADTWNPPAQELALAREDLAVLADRAGAVALPPALARILAELRGLAAAEGMPVSDRRWVKILHLLRVAAAAEGRAELAAWDLLLLPWLTAPDARRQTEVADWLMARLGAASGFSPDRVTRAVAAFEAQLRAEREANDLDYDESGRLRLSPNDMADTLGDAKGGAAALRMRHGRARRYGETHIAARVGQVDELLERIAGYADEIAAYRLGLSACRQASLWLESGILGRAEAALAGTAEAVAELAARATTAREGFLALPRLPRDDGALPEPVLCESLEAAPA